MEKKYRYCLVGYSNKVEILLKSLRDRTIPFKHGNQNAEKHLQTFVFYLDEDQKKEMQREFLAIRNPLNYDAELIYSIDEIENSDYLFMLCETPTISIENLNRCFRYECYHHNVFGEAKHEHEYQKDSFVVKREPNHVKKHFFIDATGIMYLFADLKVKSVVEQNGITGMNFESVFRKNGIAYENIFQVKGETTIPDFKLSFLEPYGIVKTCKYCGKRQLSSTADYAPLVINMKLTKDFYDTDLVFGLQKSPGYIISARLYKLLKDKNLLIGCHFAPVITRYSEQEQC